MTGQLKVGTPLVLVGLLAISSVAARFARSEILDTDRYVTMVTPLASDPVIQGAVTDRVTDEVFRQVDITGLTEEGPDRRCDHRAGWSIRRLGALCAGELCEVRVQPARHE